MWIAMLDNRLAVFGILAKLNERRIGGKWPLSGRHPQASLKPGPVYR